MLRQGIKILSIRPGSRAEAIGLLAGDRIISVNGHEISDELALQYHLSEEHAVLRIRRCSGTEEYLHVDLPNGVNLGVEVEEFKTRTCNNSCVFCFVDQLPPGVRSTLKVKDDDYRLSFLHGNYVTLTNLRQSDIARIIEQKLSPLYVSVHATDPELRAWMLGRKKPDDLEEKLKVLIRGGIQLHAQIVLIPGINDGECLDRTLTDLFRLYPGILSVAMVPIGLSKYGKPKDRFAPVTPEFSSALIQRCAKWQAFFRKKIGKNFAYLADEFYLQAGCDVPQRDYYDDFAQIEDGVGMVRSFLDDFDLEIRRREKFRLSLQGTLITGKLFYPILSRCIRRMNEKFGCRLKVLEVENRFLGNTITVAGLLGGKDIRETLKHKALGDFVIVPEEALSRVDPIFVDDLSLTELSVAIGLPVYPGGRTVKQFFNLLFKRLTADGSRPQVLLPS